MPQSATLKMPAALETLVINVYSSLELGYVLIQQTPAKFINGKWYIDINIIHPDDHLRLVKTDERPGA